MARPGFQASNAPLARSPQPASSAPIAPRAELPFAPQTKPAVSLLVLVRTPRMIGGQHEHAAIITRVFSGGVINVILMPDGDAPYPIPEIPYDDAPLGGRITWRWPPR